jgi:HlyD family secretion protein
MRFVRNPRLVAAVVSVAVILAVALWPVATDVDVARVVRGPMRVTIDEEGETRVRERFVVSAPVAGRLQRIELEPGDPVVRGTTVVARLTPAAAPLLDLRSQAELAAAVESARSALGQAQAERARASAALARARSSLKRQEELAEAGVLSRDDLETSQTTLRTSEEAMRASEFAVARAESELQLARARLLPSTPGARTVDVHAPVDGVVLKRLRESESVVPVGEPLVEIGDPRSLEIVADLLSTDAVRVAAGSPVLVEDWGGDQPLEGRVRRVEPSGFMKVSALGVEEQRVNIIVDFADPAAAARRLGDAYRVEVRVVTWQDDAVLKVPVGALFRSGDRWAVFVVDAGRARLQEVRLGQQNQLEGQVLDGLTEGQTIVLHPPDTLTDGTRVTERGT